MYISAGMGNICFPLSYALGALVLGVMFLFKPTNIITFCVFLYHDSISEYQVWFFLPNWTTVDFVHSSPGPIIGYIPKPKCTIVNMYNVCLNNAPFLKDVCYMWVTLALGDIHNSKYASMFLQLYNRNKHFISFVYINFSKKYGQKGSIIIQAMILNLWNCSMFNVTFRVKKTTFFK